MTDCPPIADLARMIDHSALHPTMTDRELEGHCATAREQGCASICVKPYAVPMARARLAGSATAVCTVIGFPHDSAAIGIKVAETLRACDDGATEIDLVINIGKALSEDWGYIAAELGELQAAVNARKAISKIIFEVDFLKDAHIIKLCRLCTDAGCQFVKTSTGYGYVKLANGDYNYKGATSEALKLMAASVGPGVQLKAAGGVRTLDDLLRVRALGCTRVGATATVAILDEARKRHGLAVSGKPATASASGY